MLQGHTMAIVPCGNPTPKKLPTGGGEWPTFRTARAQRTVRPLRGRGQLRSRIGFPPLWGPREGRGWVCGWVLWLIPPPGMPPLDGGGGGGRMH